MKYTKLLVIGALMAAIAAIFQPLPALLSELAVILTILNALPIAAAAMTTALSFMNYVVGIPIFGTAISGSLPVQFIILLLFSFCYNLVYNLFADFIYLRIKNIGMLKNI
ncbi:MAG TPA: hypothetical protein VN131_00835 [Mobilitalea sp.]|nr:hypothetical protein [Mobilitalea sp.]